MPFNQDEFRNTLLNGGARPTLFEMELRWPPTVTTGRLAETLSRFMVQIAEIPGSTVGSIEIPYFGRKIKVAGDREFASLNVTIVNDENFAIRRAMEEWSDRMAGHRDAVMQYRGGNASGGYTTDGTLTQFGRQGDRLRAYNFVGMFPTEIAPIPVDWNATNQIETFSVTFAYQWWTVAGQIPTRDNPSVTVDVNVGING
tara:strand:+ start:8825 stop:9424 length:600 start_codon:yes stop_codon:yes gene_type:complete